MRFAMRHTHQEIYMGKFSFLFGTAGLTVPSFRSVPWEEYLEGTERFEPFLFLRTEWNDAEKGGTGHTVPEHQKFLNKKLFLQKYVYIEKKFFELFSY